MPYNPLKHNRQSIRTKGYDYTQPGYYFVTICTQYRLRLFGEIVKRRMCLNPPGKMVDFWWRELENKFPHVRLNEYVIMPDHFHGIIEITEPNRGADLCVSPVSGDVCPIPCRRADLRVSPESQRVSPAPPSDCSTPHQRADLCVSPEETDTHVGVPLGTMVQWFKTMSTNAYIHGVKNNGWPRFEKRLWNRNYFDRIITSERQLHNVINYIRMNPSRWKP